MTDTAKRLSASFSLWLILAVTPLSAATYYVDSAAGNDAASGTAMNTPWQSLAKINGTAFQPGDTLLLKRGGTWLGTLNPKGSGASGNPILLSTYGTNAAAPLVNGNGNTDALVLTNQQYWEISGLEVINPGSGTTTERRGIHLCAANLGTVNHLHVSNCYVHNICGRVDGTPHAGDNSDLVAKRTGGIVVEVITDAALATRFNDILIQACTISSVTNQGIVACANRSVPGDFPGTAGWNTHYCSNLIIRSNVINDVCKNAMSIRYADATGLLEHNLVFNTANTTDGNQICSYSCRGTVFQYNEGYANNGDGAADGSLYDADLRSPQTVWQYSYSHDNSWGLFCNYPAADTNGDDTGIIVRYNISQNDRGDIFAFSGASGNSSSATVYNNTVYTTNISTLFFDDRVGGHVNGVYGNIFYSPTGATNLYNFHSYNTYTFGNNLFYGAHPSDEPSDAHKLTSNPLLVAPGLGGGMGGTNNLSTLSGYKLQAGSPCIDSGFMPTTNLTGNVNAAGQDFFGNPVPAGPGPDRGASEWLAVPGLSLLATVVQPNSATLAAQVNPGNAATASYFAYGTTTAYGGKTATNVIPAGTVSQTVSNQITGLLPGTLYHYCAVATNFAGLTNTADASFTTKVVATPRLTAIPEAGTGGWQIDFTNTPGASFSVLGATNLLTPSASWTVVGTMSEMAPGQYQFFAAYTNRPIRFYEVRSP